jgi:hypothetical protein
MLENLSFSINILFFIIIAWLFFLFLGKKNKSLLTDDDIKKLTEVIKISDTRENLANNVRILIEKLELFGNFVN